MKFLLTLASIVLITGALTANNFNDKQKAIIYNEAIKLLQMYQNLSDQMADAVVDIDQTNKLSQNIIDLFVNRKAIIYNDLDPAHKLSQAYELETYIANMLLWYPDGMKFIIDFNNLKAGNIIEHGTDIYTVDLMVSKKINGNYLNRQTNQLTEELLFRIAFINNQNNFNSFKIAGIRSSKSNFEPNNPNSLSEIKSVKFTDTEMAMVYDQSRALLNDYINFINLLADPNETTEDKGYYRISFIGLFKDTAINVANDIEPDPEKRWIAVAEYEKNLVKMYPDGIRNLGLNLDSAEYGKIIPEGANKYYINGYINKFFSGKYQDKYIHRDNSKYDFKISFERDENTFKNFKLASIDKFGVNLYSQNNTAITAALPQLPVKPLQRQGFYYGLYFNPGFLVFTDNNLTGPLNPGWQTANKISLSGVLKANYYFTANLCATVAIGVTQYKVNMALNGNYTSQNIFYTAIANEPYYKIIDAAYDSTITYNYLTIPMSVIYHSNKNPEKWGFYAEAAITANINIKATYKTTGYINTTGYFPNLPTAAQYLNNYPEWGLVNYTSGNMPQKPDSKSFVLTGALAIGITYPLDYYTTVFVGPEMVFSLTNLANTNEFTNVFGNIYQSQKIGFSKYGIKFGINYKF